MRTDNPLSFYAATKKSNEVMAYSYANIFKIPSTALRFFTVYGPFGRPDMALFKFAKNIIMNKKIPLFNSGNHTRDFTYIADIVEGIFLLIKKPPKSKIPYRCFNIGNGKPAKLKKFLNLIENNLNIKSKVYNMPLQTGDVKKTHSDISFLKKITNYKPKTRIDDGIKEFIKWYKEYFRIK